MPKTSTPVDEHLFALLDAALATPKIEGLVVPIGDGIYFGVKPR